MGLAPANRRSVATTTLTASISKLARMGLSLVTLPLLLGQFGSEGLGVWLVVISLQGLFGFVASGFCSSTTTAIARAQGAKDSSVLLSVYSSAFFLALSTSVLILTVGLIPISLVDWHEILNVGRGMEPSNVSALVVVVFVGIAFNFLASFPQSVLMGTGEGYAFYVSDLLGVLCSAAGLIVATALKQPIYVVAGAFLGLQLLVPFAGGLLWLTIRLRGGLRWSYVDADVCRRLMRQGTTLTLHQAAFSLASQSDLVLIGLLKGPSAGTAYGIAQRLFAIPFLVLGTLADAMWPMFARAHARGSHGWLARSFVALVASLGVLSATAAATILLTYSDITRAWLGSDMPKDLPLIAGAAVICVLQVVLHVCSVLLQSLERTKFIAVAMLAMAIINVPVSAFLVSRWGASGAVWGSVIAYTFCLAIPYSMILRTLLKSGRSRAL